MAKFFIDNINEEGQRYQRRVCKDEEQVQRKLHSAIELLERFPNDSIVITMR